MFEKFNKTNSFENKRILIEKDFSKISKILEKEIENNEEFSEVILKIKSEYERAKSKSFDYIKKLKNEGMSDFEWFIPPSVLTRTDFGYSNDMDIYVIYDEDEISPKVVQENIIENTFFMPEFISFSEIEKASEKFPKIEEWFRKKIIEDKVGDKNNKEFDDLYQYEDRLRYSLSEDVREEIREFRIKLAEYFIETAKKDGVGIKGWSIEGSTADNDKKFSICSDLDLNIEVDLKDYEDESNVNFYFNKYLKNVFKEKYGVKIDFHIESIDYKEKIKK